MGESKQQTNEQEKQECVIFRKINPGWNYTIYKKVNNGIDFYSIFLKQEKFDGTTYKYYQPVYFKKNVKLENGTIIKIIKAFENDRQNPKDPYSFIRSYTITEFEVVGTKDAVYQEHLPNGFDEEIYNGYQKQNQNNFEDDLPF